MRSAADAAAAAAAQTEAFADARRDNTGARRYDGGAALPTAAFPSDHALVSAAVALRREGGRGLHGGWGMQARRPYDDECTCTEADTSVIIMAIISYNYGLQDGWGMQARRLYDDDCTEADTFSCNYNRNTKSYSESNSYNSHSEVAAAVVVVVTLRTPARRLARSAGPAAKSRLAAKPRAPRAAGVE